MTAKNKEKPEAVKKQALVRSDMPYRFGMHREAEELPMDHR